MASWVQASLNRIQLLRSGWDHKELPLKICSHAPLARAHLNVSRPCRKVLLPHDDDMLSRSNGDGQWSLTNQLAVQIDFGPGRIRRQIKFGWWRRRRCCRFGL